MQDKLIEFAPAKINLYLKILNKRSDNFHNILSGVTLVNLFDEIIVEDSTSFIIHYTGPFAPKSKIYRDCILEKLFTLFKIPKPNLKFIIKKNIPVQGGMGSASTNAAAMFRILDKLHIYKIKNINETVKLSADLPLFLNQKDCIVSGMGEKITEVFHPKYYFVVVKPLCNCSTKEMYELISNNQNYKINNDSSANLNEFNAGNDFESIISEEYKEISIVLNYLKSLNNVIFSRISGSGSCCYAAFKTKMEAKEAEKNLSKQFPLLWNRLVENNIRS